MGLRNVGRNRRRSLIAGSMIALAVAGVVFFKGYTTGIERMMLDGAVSSLNGAFQVQRQGYAEAQDLAPLDLDLPEGQGVEALVLAHPNVKAISPRLRFTGLVGNGDTSALFVGIALDPERERDVCPLGLGTHPADGAALNALVSGAPLSKDDEEGIVLATDLARGLGLEAGDPVTLQARTRAGSIEALEAHVRGVFRFDDPMNDKLLALVPLRLAQRLVHMPGRVTAFAVAVRDLGALDATVAALRAPLSSRSPAMGAHPWMELAPYLRDVIELQAGLFRAVLVVVVALVVAGVVNTMTMSVLERRREIGTLVAMGFPRRAILLLFLVEAAWLGALSAAAGVGMGIVSVAVARRAGIGFAIPSGARLLVYPEVHPAHLALAVAVALGGALVASVLPALRAARLRPIDALRTD
jgi:putative ABC transport system permease protein